jgi:hypothetical protein
MKAKLALKIAIAAKKFSMQNLFGKSLLAYLNSNLPFAEQN